MSAIKQSSPIASHAGPDLVGPHLDLAVDDRGCVTMTAKPGLIDDLQVAPRFDARPLLRLAPTSLVLDLSLLEGIDSRLIVWMISIAQSFSGIAMTIRAGRRAVTQLRMLRLDRMFAIES